MLHADDPREDGPGALLFREWIRKARKEQREKGGKGGGGKGREGGREGGRGEGGRERGGGDVAEAKAVVEGDGVEGGRAGGRRWREKRERERETFIECRQ